MGSEINEIRKFEVQKGKILGAIFVYRVLGLLDDEVLEKLQEKYHLSWKEAKNCLQVETG